MAEVEVLVSFRVVTRVCNCSGCEARMMREAEASVRGRLPRGAYDVRVEALHCPPVTASPTRVRYAE